MFENLVLLLSDESGRLKRPISHPVSDPSLHLHRKMESARGRVLGGMVVSWKPNQRATQVLMTATARFRMSWSVFGAKRVGRRHPFISPLIRLTALAWQRSKLGMLMISKRRKRPPRYKEHIARVAGAETLLRSQHSTSPLCRSLPSFTVLATFLCRSGGSHDYIVRGVVVELNLTDPRRWIFTSREQQPCGNDPRSVEVPCHGCATSARRACNSEPPITQSREIRLCVRKQRVVPLPTFCRGLLN